MIWQIPIQRVIPVPSLDNFVNTKFFPTHYVTQASCNSGPSGMLYIRTFVTTEDRFKVVNVNNHSYLNSRIFQKALAPHDGVT